MSNIANEYRHKLFRFHLQQSSTTQSIKLQNCRQKRGKLVLLKNSSSPANMYAHRCLACHLISEQLAAIKSWRTGEWRQHWAHPSWPFCGRTSGTLCGSETSRKEKWKDKASQGRREREREEKEEREREEDGRWGRAQDRRTAKVASKAASSFCSRKNFLSNNIDRQKEEGY